MWSRVQRRSERIFVQESRKAAEARSKNERNGTGLEGAHETSTTRCPERKPSRKRKTRPVQDLAGTWSGLQNDANAAGMSFEIPLPDKETLVLVLDALKKKDSYDIFAEPVDPNEVEDYYDIIEEPMDFSTIAKKIDDESYRTLNEFEHDLYLVYNNAMYFNAPDTIYYKQAVSIRNLVERLLYVVVTEPRNLATELGKKRAIDIERKKDDAECSNTRDMTTGWSNEQESEDLLPSLCSTDTSHTSFGDESLMSQVLKSSKKLELENPFKYSKSLMRFAKDLGPMAQTVAMRKIVGGVAETSTHQIAASISRLQTPSNQITAVILPLQGIKTDVSLKFLGHSAGCQRISGREVDLQSNTSKERAFVGCTTKAPGDVHGKMILAENQVANGVSVHQHVRLAPSSRFPVLSAGRYPFSAGLSQGGNIELGGRSVDWCKPTGLGVEANADAEGLSQEGNFKPGGQISSQLKPMEVELEPFPDSLDLSQGDNMEFGGQISNWFTPKEWVLERMPDAVNPNYAGNVNHGGESSNSFKPTESDVELIPYAASPNHGANVTDGGQFSDSFKLNETGLELIPDAASPNNAGSSKHGELSNPFKPTESGPEPNTDDWLQEQCGQLVDMNMLSQAEPLSLQGWTITPYDEKPMNPTCM